MSKREWRRDATSDNAQRVASSARARILLVDDDERNLLALSEVLDDLAEVVTATSGRQALRHLLHGEFAVILLDVFMPEMDGYETAGMIRERGQTARIPIIFLSAVNKETEHLRRGYAMGAVDYVFKPVDPVMLKSKVAVFVDLYEMRLQVEAKSHAEQALRDANFQAELDRLRMERELEATQGRQAAILDALPLALYEARLDDAGIYRRHFVGGDLGKLAGDDADLIERGDLRWEDRIHPDDAVMIADRMSANADGEMSLEYRWSGGTGEIRHFIDQSVRMADPTSTRWAGTLIDITQQKRLEEQLVQAGKMDAIGQLTGGIAHDFNNLLAAVLGGLHLLQQRVEFGPREQMVVDQMRHAGEQGAELVRRMMAFARKQDLTPTSIDPASLCTSVAGLVEHTMGGTVIIDWQCPDTSCNLYADRSQLELALVNLILNARDAMPDGGRLAVSLDEIDDISGEDGLTLEPGQYLRIRVCDEGGGIPFDIIDKVTEPFFTTKEAGKGTGLGLSMVVGFVQQSGGKMHISSETGRGTTIDLYLPSTPQPAPIVVPPEPASVATGKVRSVLLVDDDTAVRTVLGEQLREMGLTVETAVDGDSAISWLCDNASSIDLLLTDFAMPGKNGVETIRCAQQQHPGLRAVLMTGYADDPSIDSLRELIPILRKPIIMADLVRALA